MNTKNIKYLLSALMLSLLLITISNSLYGQEDKLNKEVQVVRPYEPSISDAFKINLLPQISDTAKLTPTLNYNINQRPFSTNFTVTPISPAKMLIEPLSDLSNTYIRVGLGPTISPLLEVYYNSGRNKEFNYGGWFQSHSDIGKVKLKNGDRVDCDFGRTNFKIFGKKILKKSILSADAGFSKHKVTYYGYDVDATSGTLETDTTPSVQHFNQVYTNLRYSSSYTDSTHLNYVGEIGFSHYKDRFDMQETFLNISVKMDKFTNGERFGGEFQVHHYMKNSNLDSANNTLVTLAPWINFFGKQWRALAGAKIVFDKDASGSHSTMYPIGLLSYDIISHYLIPYIEIGGYMEENSYQKISEENPWILPGKKVYNTSHKLILTGGIKGNLSTKVSYILYANYSIIDSMYFFVNTSTYGLNPLNNRFTVESDNVELTKFLGELTIAPSSKINFFFRAEYDSYKMNKLAKPWHKPDFSALGSIRYNLRDKIVLNLDIFSTGKRYVKVSDTSNKIKSLEGITDINLGVEYRYNKKISGFLNLNNITSAKQDIYYLYPMYRFNVKLGLTYIF